MRRILLLFSLCGFVLGGLVGLIGHFMLAPGGTRDAVASTGGRVPTFYLSGIDGAADDVGATIEGAVRHRLKTGGAFLVDRPSACAIDVAGILAHRMDGEKVLVTLVWLIRTGAGEEIARVQMRNTVPAAMLNGDWSGDAPHIARTVEDALHRIVTEKRVPLC